jgi:hypothetical protein
MLKSMNRIQSVVIVQILNIELDTWNPPSIRQKAAAGSTFKKMR